MQDSKKFIQASRGNIIVPSSIGQLQRRSFLASLAALGAGTLLPGCATDSAPGALAAGKPRRIDVHHHYVPPGYLAAIPRARASGTPPAWTPALSLEDMDRNGIALSIGSIIPEGVWFGDVALARRLGRMVNDYGAELVRDYPGRYGLFATLALPDVEGSLKEIEYALDVLKADGFALMTSFDTRYLGDAAFWPVLEELNRRRAVVYTHPLQPACCKNPIPSLLSASAIEYPADTSRTIASLLFTGAAARFPDIRWIFSHGGGVLPFVYSRYTRQEAAMKDRAKYLPNGVAYEIKKFYYETAQANHAGAIQALLKITPLSQVLFGTDYPFRPGAEEVEGISGYGFSAAELEAIERGNALRLLPRWKT
ncbi:MAG: TIM-barrel fold metal-dependent hydrolase [Betaproteobacteria bacterium]|nr:TIM-barrel fold metal-dependent hydrolase [Betaproteobacteria bacterium]